MENIHRCIPNGFYVYILLDPRYEGLFKYGEDLEFCFRPYYVGKGVGRRYLRHFHESEFKRTYNQHKNNITKKIMLEGYDPIDFVVFFRDGMEESSALELEKEIISKIGCTSLKNGPLSNKTSGGESPGSFLRGLTWEQRYGEDKAKEMKIKASKIQKTIKKPDQSGEKNAFFGKKHSEETKLKLRNCFLKPIVRISEFLDIKEYSSPCVAAEEMKNCLSTSISHSATQTSKGIHCTSANFVWIYKKAFENFSQEELKEFVKRSFLRKNHDKKKICQLDRNTKKVIKVWESISDAAENIFGSRKRTGDISAAITHDRQCMGFRWENATADDVP